MASPSSRTSGGFASSKQMYLPRSHLASIFHRRKKTIPNYLNISGNYLLTVLLAAIRTTPHVPASRVLGGLANESSGRISWLPPQDQDHDTCEQVHGPRYALFQIVLLVNLS